MSSDDATPIAARVAALIRPEIRSLAAYHVPDAGGFIKLDAMENPWPWPGPLHDAWCATLRDVALNRYPDPGATRLCARLKTALDVPGGEGGDMDVLLGNGSDELIQMILMAVARSGAVIAAPTPTFVMYELIAKWLGLEFAGVPLRADFSLDREGFLGMLAARRPAVTFLACPNNPTGNLFDWADVEAIAQASPGLVVVDEAYHAFCGESFMDRLARVDNVLVLRTLSKQGLAGLRLGILAGDRRWLSEIDKVRLPYNIGTLTQASALFALDHLDVMAHQADAIRAERDKLHDVLAAKAGISVWPSRANFLLFRAEARPAIEVFEDLKREGVLIKNLSPQGGLLANCLRVTVGTAEENVRFLDALRAK